MRLDERDVEQRSLEMRKCCGKVEEGDETGIRFADILEKIVKVYLACLKDDRQRFLQQVSKKQFRTVYYNANTCG